MGHDSLPTNDNQEIVLKSPRNSISPENFSSSKIKCLPSNKSMRRTSSSGDIIILESPDLILNSENRCNLSSFRTYFECSGPWKFLISNRRQELNQNHATIAVIFFHSLSIQPIIAT